MIQRCEKRIENGHQNCAYHITLKFEFSNLPIIVSPFGLSFFHCIAKDIILCVSTINQDIFSHFASSALRPEGHVN